MEINVNFKMIHLVGHSIGAHIVGLAAKQLEIGRLSVVVGLDPALPLFDLKNINERIEKSDADYVEIIHTASGILGLELPIFIQPGCSLFDFFKDM